MRVRFRWPSYLPLTMSDDEKLRQECHELEGLLRGEPAVPERAFRLFEIILVRLDRIETGVFAPAEAPTAPERRKSSGAMPAARGIAARVAEELKKGRDEG